MVFQKTGTNEYGAVTGTLTLYGRGYADKIAESAAFSGGFPGKGPIPEGTFTIQLDIRDTVDFSDLHMTAAGAELKQFYGIQQIPADVGGYDARWEWGSIRAGLNPAPGETRSEYLGNFLHGKNRRKITRMDALLNAVSKYLSCWYKWIPRSRVPSLSR
jgi:hypothetical protein